MFIMCGSALTNLFLYGGCPSGYTIYATYLLNLHATNQFRWSKKFSGKRICLFFGIHFDRNMRRIINICK